MNARVGRKGKSRVKKKFIEIEKEKGRDEERKPERKSKATRKC